MSHVSEMKIIIKDLDALKAAAKDCGLVMSEAKTYRWYGRHIGDYPMPDGFAQDDLGHCDYKLSVPGSDSAYEIGVVKRKDGKGYALLYDFWGASGKELTEKIGGEVGNLLKQRYATRAATESAIRQGFRVEEYAVAGGGVQLRMSK